MDMEMEMKMKMKSQILSHTSEFTFNDSYRTEINIIKEMFPELKNEDIYDVLKQNQYNVESTIDELLSLRFIRQGIENNNNKNNSSEQSIDSNGNKNNLNITGKIESNPNPNSNINTNVIGKKGNNNLEKTKVNYNEGNIINNNGDGNDTSITNVNLSMKKKKKKKKKKKPNSSNEDEFINGKESTPEPPNSNNVAFLTQNELNGMEKDNQMFEHININSNTDTYTRNKSMSDSKSMRNQNSVFYYKLNELNSMFPGMNERLLVLTLQANKGDMEKSIETLLTRSCIKNEIEDIDICKSLELQIMDENDPRNNHCDGNCIYEGYPCLIHSALVLYEKDDKKQLSLPSILKNWENGLYSYCEDEEDDNELLFFKQIKEVEKNMTEEEIRHSDDISFFRNRETLFKQERNEYFEKASRKYKNKGLTGFSSASYYSEKGRDLEIEIEKARLLAIRAQIKQNEKSFKENYINVKVNGVDLHGLTVTEAIPYLNDSLYLWKKEVSKSLKKKAENEVIKIKGIPKTYNYGETFDINDSERKSFLQIASSPSRKKVNNSNSPMPINIEIKKKDKKKKKLLKFSKTFIIITGKGNHSDANIGARLRPIIIKYLKNNKYKFNDADYGYIEVQY